MLVEIVVQMLRHKMGLLIKALLGALVVVLIGVLSKPKLLYCRFNSVISDLRADCPLYRRQQARH